MNKNEISIRKLNSSSKTDQEMFIWKSLTLLLKKIKLLIFRCYIDMLLLLLKQFAQFFQLHIFVKKTFQREHCCINCVEVFRPEIEFSQINLICFQPSYDRGF